MSWQQPMSLTVFLTICIIGCDFLIYVLYQWIFGEKYRVHARRGTERKGVTRSGPLRPYLVSSRTPGRDRAISLTGYRQPFSRIHALSR